MSKITKKIKYAVQINIINFLRELKIKLCTDSYISSKKMTRRTHYIYTLIRFEHFKTLLTKNHPYYYNLVHNV